MSLVDINALKRTGVLCLNPEYIGEYLVQEESPDPSKFCVTSAQEQTPKKRAHAYGTVPTQSKKARLS